MRIPDAIRKMSDQPLSRQVVLAQLKDYSNPNDKIHGLIAQGVLQPVKRGFYIAGPAIEGPRPEPTLLANHLVGPSYVTADTALSFYGLIPERVFTVTSATTRPSVEFQTPLGVFSYRNLPLPYYAFGISEQVLTERQHALIAMPQKAIFDKVITTSRIIISSRKEALHLLLDNWRMDESTLRSMDWTEAKTWLQVARKADSLRHLIEAIQSL